MTRELFAIVMVLVKMTVFLLMMGAISRFAWLVLLAGWNVTEIF